MQVQQVPWSKEAAYRLPVSVWREAVDAHFPNSAWITMSRQTLERPAAVQDRAGPADLGRDADQRCSPEAGRDAPEAQP